jgi:hypothetical protein
MTTKTLHCHPATPADAVRALSVEIVQSPEACLTLRYRLAGDFAKISLPAAQASGTGDGLWQHTCFEAFVAGQTPAYHEFNFSPSGQWAAYAFAGYRERVPWDIGQAPAIEVSRSQDQLMLTAHIMADDLPAGDRLQLGLTAVVEATDGSLSYWALHHTGERPDFHDRASFTHSLSRESASFPALF